MTLTLDIETWLNFTAHPLTKGSLLVEYEQDWTKGERDKWFRKDGLITTGRLQSGVLIRDVICFRPLVASVNIRRRWSI